MNESRETIQSTLEVTQWCWNSFIAPVAIVLTSSNRVRVPQANNATAVRILNANVVDIGFYLARLFAPGKITFLVGWQSMAAVSKT